MREKLFNHPFLVFVSYALLTIIMTWPLAGLLGTHIPGSEGDAWVHLWTFHYVRDTLLNGGKLFYTDLMYHPDGVSLLYHNFAWLHIALWLPLQALVGEAAAYTLIFMGGFAFTGLTTYLLAREVLQNNPAAYISGLIAAFWPYILSHHNHPNLIFIGFVPLVMLYIKRVLTTKRPRDIIILGVMIALLGIARWQLLVIGGFLIALYLIWQLMAVNQARSAQTAVADPTAVYSGLMHDIGRLTIAGLLAFVLMMPLLLPLLSEQLGEESLEELEAGEQRVGQTDLLAYITPSRYHPLWGDAVFPLTENYTVDRVFTPFLGFTTLLLAIFGTFRRWRSARFWLLAAVVYMVLALGGLLQINGHFYFWMPYRLLEDTFIGTLVRRSSRFNVILCIPIAILAGWGVTVVYDFVTRRRTQLLPWVLPIVALLILFEYVVVYETYSLYTPQWYSQLAEEKEAFAILDLPMNRRTYDEQYMFYQFTHGKALVEGHVSRPPVSAFDTINAIRFLRDFRIDNSPIPEITNVGLQLRPLAALNVRYLVLHKQFLDPTKLRAWKNWLAIPPYYEDSELVVYHTELLLGRDYTLQESFLPEVGVVSSVVTPTTVMQDGWVDVNVVWGSAATVQGATEICLNLVDSKDKAYQTRCKTPSTPLNQWQTGEIIRDQYRIHINPYLQGGQYTVTAELRNTAVGQRIGERIALGTVDILAVERDFTSPNPSVMSKLVWGENLLDLHGYDIEPTNEQLVLTLYWHAQQRPRDSYVVFVHLIDPQTGEIVSQSDAAPRAWGYPTNWWEANEYIADTVTIPWADLPAGSYQLYIGMYEAQSQERLEVRQDGVVVDNAAVWLTDVVKP